MEGPAGILEKTLESSGGNSIVVIAALLALHLIWKVFELVFDWGKNKAKQSDQSRVDIIRLEFEIKGIKEDIEKTLRVSEDTLAAVRVLAGEKWHEVAKKVKEGELHRR